jgi:hypothetical protein
VTFDEVDLAHIRFRDAVDCHAHHNHFGRTRPTTQGYGVSFVDCAQDCSATHNVFDGCRHSLSTNNTGAYGGVPRRILFESNFVRDSAPALGGSMAGGDAIDTHAAADWIIIRNNICVGATGQGVNIECPNAIVEGNHIEGATSNGINWRNETPRVGSVRIANNSVLRCNATTSHRGIRAGAGSGQTTNTARSVQIVANMVSECVGSAITVEAPAAGWPSAVVSGNEVSLCGGTLGEIVISNLLSVTFTGNSIFDQVNVAASLRLSDVGGGVVSANSIRNTTPGGTSANAIWVSGTGAGISITGNFIHLDNVVATRRAVLLADTVTNSSVVANTIRNATAAVTLGSGAGNISANNVAA